MHPCSLAWSGNHRQLCSDDLCPLVHPQHAEMAIAFAVLPASLHFFHIETLPFIHNEH